MSGDVTGPDWPAIAKADDLGRADGEPSGGQPWADVGVDGTVDEWPKPTSRPRISPLDKVRGTLIDAPGQAQRLTSTFDREDQASAAAVLFAETDPAAVVPGATGYFQTVTVADQPDTSDSNSEKRVWRVVARYVPPKPTTLFPDFQTWMVEWLIPIIHRPLRGGVTWCPEWWRHAEAVVRLDAVWRAWEEARSEGGSAMAHWWQAYFDTTFAELTSDRGPFASCKDKVHDGKLEMLPCNPAPEDWPWPSDEETSDQESA